jgi:hypothetical protein
MRPSAASRCGSKIGVPPQGLGERIDQMTAWLDTNCGADGWTMAPAGLRGVVNDAVAVYFLDPSLAAAFVARWCVTAKIEMAKGAFQVREDAPIPRAGAPFHRTP